MPRKTTAKSKTSGSETSSYSTRSRRKKDGSVETSESETEITAIDATSTAPETTSAKDAKIETKKPTRKGRPPKKKGAASESESEMESTTTAPAAGTVINGTTIPQANETIISTTNIVPPQTPKNKRRNEVDDTVTKENSDPNATVSQVRVKERLESILEEFDIEGICFPSLMCSKSHFCFSWR